MKKVTLGEGLNPVEAKIFTGGRVQIQPLVGDKDAHLQRLALVHFTDGAHTLPHTHSFDQVLLATEGKGFCATAEEEHEMAPGDIVVIPAQKLHWHGARPGETFAHINIAVPGETRLEDGSAI